MSVPCVPCVACERFAVTSHTPWFSFLTLFSPHKVAVKELFRNLSGSALEEFEREVTLMTHMRHPNIIQVLREGVMTNPICNFIDPLMPILTSPLTATLQFLGAVTKPDHRCQHAIVTELAVRGDLFKVRGIGVGDAPASRKSCDGCSRLLLDCIR